MAFALSRSGENVSDFNIGKFGDLRLAKTGALFFKRLSEKLTASIKALAGNRATEVAFHRFLDNENVTNEEIINELTDKTNVLCLDKQHVLCLQDTVQLTYPDQPIKKYMFGSTGDADTNGLFIDPGVIVDASNRDLLGISSVISWCRDDENNTKSKSRLIEEKESVRWINTALSAKNSITNAGMITVIGDRESDIFEIFDRVPDEKINLIVRASHDRNTEDNEKISEILHDTKACGTYEIELPSITGKRKKRTATLEIKYAQLSLCKDGKTIDVFCVSALEISPVPKKENRVSWVLLTTHVINSFKCAKQILIWYTWRWIIEQIFRVMKNKGLKIEDSQIENPKKLQILSTLCLATAIKILTLVESRDGKNKRSTFDLFTREELAFLHVLCKKIIGKTEKQKNPHTKNSMAWASWIIGRLGGWNGYASESPPGPITMLRGLIKFEMQYEGWNMAQ